MDFDSFPLECKDLGINVENEPVSVSIDESTGDIWYTTTHSRTATGNIFRYKKDGTIVDTKFSEGARTSKPYDLHVRNGVAVCLDRDRARDNYPWHYRNGKWSQLTGLDRSLNNGLRHIHIRWDGKYILDIKQRVVVIDPDTLKQVGNEIMDINSNTRAEVNGVYFTTGIISIWSFQYYDWPRSYVTEKFEGHDLGFTHQDIVGQTGYGRPWSATKKGQLATKFWPNEEDATDAKDFSWVSGINDHWDWIHTKRDAKYDAKPAPVEPVKPTPITPPKPAVVPVRFEVDINPDGVTCERKAEALLTKTFGNDGKSAKKEDFVFKNTYESDCTLKGVTFREDIPSYSDFPILTSSGI